MDIYKNSVLEYFGNFWFWSSEQCTANDIIRGRVCSEDSFNVVMSHLVINYAVEDTLH